MNYNYKSGSNVASEVDNNNDGNRVDYHFMPVRYIMFCQSIKPSFLGSHQQ